jgi:hypothetical protein
LCCLCFDITRLSLVTWGNYIVNITPTKHAQNCFCKFFPSWILKVLGLCPSISIYKFSFLFSVFTHWNIISKEYHGILAVPLYNNTPHTNMHRKMLIMTHRDKKDKERRKGVSHRRCFSWRGMENGILKIVNKLNLFYYFVFCPTPPQHICQKRLLCC